MHAGIFFTLAGQQQAMMHTPKFSCSTHWQAIQNDQGLLEVIDLGQKRHQNTRTLCIQCKIFTSISVLSFIYSSVPLSLSTRAFIHLFIPIHPFLHLFRSKFLRSKEQAEGKKQISSETESVPGCESARRLGGWHAFPYSEIQEARGEGNGIRWPD